LVGRADDCDRRVVLLPLQAGAEKGRMMENRRVACDCSQGFAAQFAEEDLFSAKMECKAG